MLTNPANRSADPTPSGVQQALTVASAMTRCCATGTMVDLLMQGLRPFGIATFAISAAADPQRVDPLSSLLSNCPQQWADIYRAERKYLYDPIVVEAARTPGHFFWRDITLPPQSSGADLFQQARQFGMIDGVTRSVRARWPVVIALSVSGHHPAWDDAADGAVALLAQTFMARAMYIRQERLIPALRSLSEQHRAILQLASHGQSDIGIATELGVRSSDLRADWDHLYDTLGASDRVQSVAVARWSGQMAMA